MQENRLGLILATNEEAKVDAAIDVLVTVLLPKLFVLVKRRKSRLVAMGFSLLFC